MMKDSLIDGRQMIEPLPIAKGQKVNDFVDTVFAKSGYNARRLGEACRLYSKMLNEEVTVCLTLAGAMTPIGMSGPVIKLIENGFVDWIISTGANLYHDLHRPFNSPVLQGDFRADDDYLYRQGIARIYDVFIPDDTLLASDQVIRRALQSQELPKRSSTADLHYALGKEVLRTAPSPEKSILAAGVKHNVPIYCSSPGDSSIGMNLTLPFIFGKEVDVSTTLDVLETAAIVKHSKKSGVIEVGGGSPKNFFMQTQPTLWQILHQGKGGHDYFIQLTMDSPHWGGLSGATPQEARSWGKVKEADRNSVVVYSCASLTFPILCQYVEERCEQKRLKELYLKKKEFTDELIKTSRNMEEIKKQYECA
jgi:deoxyhypusine synthase